MAHVSEPYSTTDSKSEIILTFDMGRTTGKAGQIDKLIQNEHAASIMVLRYGPREEE